MLWQLQNPFTLALRKAERIVMWPKTRRSGSRRFRQRAFPALIASSASSGTFGMQ